MCWIATFAPQLSTKQSEQQPESHDPLSRKMALAAWDPGPTSDKAAPTTEPPCTDRPGRCRRPPQTRQLSGHWTRETSGDATGEKRKTGSLLRERLLRSRATLRRRRAPAEPSNWPPSAVPDSRSAILCSRRRSRWTSAAAAHLGRGTATLAQALHREQKVPGLAVLLLLLLLRQGLAAAPPQRRKTEKGVRALWTL